MVDALSSLPDKVGTSPFPLSPEESQPKTSGKDASVTTAGDYKKLAAAYGNSNLQGMYSANLGVIGKQQVGSLA